MSDNKSVEICEVDFRRNRQKRIRRILGRAVRSIISGDVAGFALVAWDGRGDAHTVFCVESGPIGKRLLPSYVADVLQQHVSVDLAQEAAINRIEGD